MENPQIAAPIYHVLLIGIDRYPPGYNSLAGCVNDIDAIEDLLLAPPGIGFPAEQIRITRLAALRPGSASRSRFQAESLAPTKANLLQSLHALSGPAVKPSDRVLIYYSGHGDEKLWAGSKVWHEALAPHNDLEIEYLFDVEINLVINAIAARTRDLTIVFDCCHSAGATRGLSGVQAAGAIRALSGDSSPVTPPELARRSLLGDAAPEQLAGSHLLQSANPGYLVVVACQSNEKAGEGAFPSGETRHGVFTYSLLNVLSEKDADQRASLRWADIWPELLAGTLARNGQLKQRVQHPWMIGRSERRVFGGPWEKMDAGYRVTRRPDGDFEVGAGQLMGVTERAEVAVYGPEPRLFPDLGSIEDQPAGRLRVIRSGPSSAIASPVGAPFPLPEGARGRLVKPGESQRLRVRLVPEDPTLQARLEESPLLEIVPAAETNAGVEVIAHPGGGWTIGNDIEPVLAWVPAGEIRALCAGLDHYYRYHTVLRMAHNCCDPQLNQRLSVRLLNGNDPATLEALSIAALADPDLPEAPRDQGRIYSLQPGFKFCLRVVNSSSYDLNVTLFNCSAGGHVEYLSDALLRAASTQVMWLDNQLGLPFEASPDELPSSAELSSSPGFVTDRLITIGTTRLDVDLRHLAVGRTVQETVNANLSPRRGVARSLVSGRSSVAPAELWTATVVPVRITKRNGESTPN